MRERGVVRILLFKNYGMDNLHGFAPLQSVDKGPRDPSKF